MGRCAHGAGVPILPQAWPPTFLEPDGRCRRNCPTDYHPPRPTPPISPRIDRGIQGSFPSGSITSALLITGNVKGRLGIRIRSEIDSRQREFTNGSAAVHHLATSTPPRTRWTVNSGPYTTRVTLADTTPAPPWIVADLEPLWSRGKVNGWQHEVRKRG